MNLLTISDDLTDIQAVARATRALLVDQCGLTSCTAQISSEVSICRAVGRREPSFEELNALAGNAALHRLLHLLDSSVAQRYPTAARWKSEVYIRVRQGNEGTPRHQDLDHYGVHMGSAACLFCRKARAKGTPVAGVCQRCEGGGLLTAWIPLVGLNSERMPILQLPRPYAIKKQPRIGQCLVFSGEVPHESWGVKGRHEPRLSLDVRYLCTRLPTIGDDIQNYINPTELSLLMEPLLGQTKDSRRLLASQRHGTTFLLSLVGLELHRNAGGVDVEACWKREKSPGDAGDVGVCWQQEDKKEAARAWMFEDYIPLAMDGAVQEWMEEGAPKDTLDLLVVRLAAEIDTRPAPKLTKTGVLCRCDEGLAYLATHVVFMATGWLGRRPAKLFWKRHVSPAAVRRKIEGYLLAVASMLRRSSALNLELAIEVSWSAWAVAGGPKPSLIQWDEGIFEAEARRYKKSRYKSDVLLHCRWLVLWQRMIR